MYEGANVSNNTERRKFRYIHQVQSCLTNKRSVSSTQNKAKVIQSIQHSGDIHKTIFNHKL